MKKKLSFLIIPILIITFLIINLLYKYNYIPHQKYNNSHFNIQTYISSIDKDNDGIDDQTDILNNALAYIKTKPKYKSKYYQTGYPNDQYGVCTDLVAISLKNAGYDLMELVEEDIQTHRQDYNIEKPDKNIDFRRVQNLKVYFQNTAIPLTTNIYDLKSWQGGDIIIFDNHIGIVSHNRNNKGVPFILHHANPYQQSYEADILESTTNHIVAHYRIS